MSMCDVFGPLAVSHWLVQECWGMYLSHCGSVCWNGRYLDGIKCIDLCCVAKCSSHNSLPEQIEWIENLGWASILAICWPFLWLVAYYWLFLHCWFDSLLFLVCVLPTLAKMLRVSELLLQLVSLQISHPVFIYRHTVNFLSALWLM